MWHRWELPDKYSIFTMVTVIYRYDGRIGQFSLPQNPYSKYDHEKNYPDEPDNI